MPIETISYAKTGYFSKLICDYLAEDTALGPFYHRYPKLAAFGDQLAEKAAAFAMESRTTLVNSLQRQYRGLTISEETGKNIASISSERTFTITTGHQLNLFTGPLYFLYKIISVINLSETLKKKYPKYHFVPVFWMATEDHDFEEINYFNLHGKKIHWDRLEGGAVGEFTLEGLTDVAKLLKAELGGSTNAKYLFALFNRAYLEHQNLADATRYLGNELFKQYGLVIIDGNDTALKKAFAPYAARELTDQLSFKEISNTTRYLTDLGYEEQVHPREINLFYLKEGMRERLLEKEGRYFVNNSEYTFSRAQLLKELDDHPERFSPNALLRPLYQEVVLPNISYTGGGGELAYWFQLKDYFDRVEVPFPILLLRNSALLVPEKLSQKMEKLQITTEEIFLPKQDLKNLHTRRISEIKIDFSPQRDHLIKQFASLYELAEKTDASFVGAVAAQEKKQLNGLDKLEKRLLKAQRRRNADELERLADIKDNLFPSGNLQERNMNFSEFYSAYGEELIEVLKMNLDPLVDKFTVIRW